MTRYGQLKVLEIYKKNSYKMARCVCDCGNKTDVYYSNVTSGRTKSCGCLERANREKFKDISNQIFGRLIA